ncbi:hypothetical protein MBUL_02520 [Methylobacterium bullatum]|uniref:Uncharacterized protein n=1 Tax=Methylobacterium bullatum TaxID=570505 RepID=A0A679IU83_9HYPH|nr:hypothetical protein MBUL_02520 [Methylobacterium bullatum]
MPVIAERRESIVAEGAAGLASLPSPGFDV